MIKKLFLVLITTAFSISATSQNSISATVASSVEAGADLTINTTYTTSNTDYKIYAGILLKNSDGTWKATVIDANINPAPAGTDKTASITLTVPSGTTKSSDLLNGEYYEMKIELQDENWDHIDGVGVYPALTINEASSGSITAALSATTVANPIEQGDDLTINVTYSTTEPTDIIKLNLERLDIGYNYVSTIVYQEKIVSANGGVGTDVIKQFSIPIPVTTPASSTIGTDFYYYKVELVKSDYSLRAGAGAYIKVTIAADGTLSVVNLEKLPATVYPNPATDILNIQSLENKQFSSYNVFDITGRKLLKNSNLDTSINVSTLSTGIYFLQIDNYKPVKFIKQ